VKPITYKEIAEFKMSEDKEEMEIGKYLEEVPDKL